RGQESEVRSRRSEVRSRKAEKQNGHTVHRCGRFLMVALAATRSRTMRPYITIFSMRQPNLTDPRPPRRSLPTHTHVTMLAICTAWLIFPAFCSANTLSVTL